MTKPRHEAKPKPADAPNEPYFIEEGDVNDLNLELPPFPTLHRARELYDVQEGETLMDAMDRASRESVAAAATQAKAEKPKPC